MKWIVIAGFAGLAAAMVMGAPSVAREESRTRLPADRCLSYPLENSRVVDRETLYLEDRSGAAALVKMHGPCMEINEAIGIKYYGSTRICGRNDVDITGSVMSNIPLQCMIDSITPLSKDEAKNYKH